MSNGHVLNLYHEASTHLVYKYPFIACPLLRLELVFTDAIETASTNGKYLELNNEFWETLTTEERVFILAHCSLHVAHMHHLRQGSRDSQLWNDAADYIVNAALKDAGFRLVDGALYDARYSEWSVEEVYAQLEAEQAKNEKEQGQERGREQAPGEGQGKGEQGQAQANGSDSSDGNDANAPQSPSDSPTSDDTDDGAPPLASPHFGGTVEPLTQDDGTPLTPTELANEEAECQLAAYQATVAQAMSGNHNASAAQRVVESVSPGFDAREELREFCERHAGRDDYDWSRPSHVFLSSANVYLPSLSRSNDLRSIVFVIDTSGSIRSEHLELMAGVIEDTLSAYPNLTINVIYADSAVRAVEEFDVNSPLPISLTGARGGGGTRFKPVFDYVEEMTERGEAEPVALVYLTDLLASDITSIRVPDYPVLWATIGRTRRTAPFGRRVDIKPSR